jgi:hypothetical protein
MKTSLLLTLAMITTTCSAMAATTKTPLQMKPQTVVVFQDHEVPQFVVVEHKGKKRVVIDRHHKTISDDKAL